MIELLAKINTTTNYKDFITSTNENKETDYKHEEVLAR